MVSVIRTTIVRDSFTREKLSNQTHSFGSFSSFEEAKKKINSLTTDLRQTLKTKGYSPQYTYDPIFAGTLLTFTSVNAEVSIQFSCKFF